MTADLVAFLRDRIAEDEQFARAGGGRSERAWRADMSGKDPLGMPSWPLVVRRVERGRVLGAVAHLPILEERSEDRMEHIARHDPARVLAEVDAKRRIIAAYEQTAQLKWPDDPNMILTVKDRIMNQAIGRVEGLMTALRLLALPYADHPDYRPEWAPDA
ncbi:MAG: hypothetical protein HOY79_19215 [Streptomyces sp.]|nr:hypothetical protein [Streptomyces sp.]NUS29125.1 hypothetical protein [Streptomyces sp.]